MNPNEHIGNEYDAMVGEQREKTIAASGSSASPLLAAIRRLAVQYENKAGMAKAAKNRSTGDDRIFWEATEACARLALSDLKMLLR